MDFGSVVLEHRPIIICQCKINLCGICNTPNEVHPIKTGDIEVDHNYFQRSKIFGPRVVIDQITKRGKCNDCGKEYIVDIYEDLHLAEKRLASTNVT